MTKRVLSVLLALCLVMGMVPVFAAAAEVASGSCGPNVTWKLEGNTLTISGTGDMYTYESNMIGFDFWLGSREREQQVETLIIKPGVTYLGGCAFWGFENLTSVTIPSTVTAIGVDAFTGCINLTTLTIPNGVESIHDYAFLDCSSLTSITLPDSVTDIGYGAFNSCSSLTSITIPNSVTRIGYPTIGGNAFSDCSSLNTITVAQSNAVYTDIEGVLFTKDMKTLVAYPGGLRATQYTIPDSVTSIGDGAFGGCSNLTSITIPASVTSIGNYSFSGCDALRDVYYGGTKEQWEQTDIGYYSNDDLLNATIYYTDSGTCGPNLTWKLENGTLTISGTGPMDDSPYSDLSGVVTPWLDYDDQIQTVIIMPGVTSIGDYAFVGCSSLTNITIPDSVTSIGEGAFKRCSALPKVTIPDGVKSIESETFQGCMSLTSITIPDSVTSIEGGAFVMCAVLRDVYYGGTEEQWELIDIDYEHYSAGDNDALLNATIHYLGVDKPDEPTPTPDGPSLTGTCGENVTWKLEGTTLTISGTGPMEDFLYGGGVGGVTPWRNYSGQIQKVIINPGVTSIGNHAFWGLALTNINIPDSVTSIGFFAFFGCYNLTSITIPASVASIGQAAFGNCRNLKDVYYSGTEKDWAKIDIDKSKNDFFDYDNSDLLNATIHFAKDSGTTPTFKDVPAGQYYAAPVAWAVGKGITNGKDSATTFKPGDTCTRAEIVTFLWRATGKKSGPAASFPDMPKNVPDFVSAINWAVGVGVTLGKGTDASGNVIFVPNGGCTRAEAVTFLWRALGKPDAPAVNRFTDMPTNVPDFVKAINWAVASGITNGKDSTTTFKPNDTCTRAEIVTFLHRAMN